MKIKTALILCAGYGKRLSPLTLEKPKPLIEVNKITLLENTINLIKKLNIQKIKINTFYLENQIENFISAKDFDLNIEVIHDGDQILGTGGGILNLIKNSNENDFIIFNPDTIWNSKYIKIIKEMENFYYNNKVQNVLMVVNKRISYDKYLKGDFSFNFNKLFNYEDKNYIFTGCQIINKNIFSNYKNTSFSISKIWNKLINGQKLYGFESLNEFIHITNLEIYNKLIKN
ncbi:MAG: sugar phosphate nucleotidyltransferase [Candidatus Pelagibacter bacterium]|nr:sugar phosphate nucleotidyltransferase [Candidatus Pelagibacter bacterium]